MTCARRGELIGKQAFAAEPNKAAIDVARRKYPSSAAAILAQLIFVARDFHATLDGS